MMSSSLGAVKKIVVTFLALSYFTMVVGATVHHHYCMDQLVGISLFDFKDDECLKCGMNKHDKESDGCCKDISVSVKSGDSHDNPQATYDSNSFGFSLNVPSALSSRINWPVYYRPNVHYAPPTSPGERLFLYKLFRNWRI